MYEYANPVAAAGGESAVNFGGAFTETVMNGDTASVPTPLDAPHGEVDDPAAVGVPDNTPVAFRLRPNGRPPLATKLGGGHPEAVNL